LPVNRVWALAGILANLAVIWLRLRIPGVAVNESIQPGNWLQNGFFFLQGLIYPFGPLAGRLVFEEKLNDFLVVGVLALMLAIGGVGIALRSRDGKWLARGLAWWLIAALPSWLMLKFSYNYISPRLYALAAPGLALLWAELFTRLAELARGIRWQRIALILLGSALLIQNVDFLLRQRQLHLDLGGVYQAVLQAASDPGNAPLLFVNLPSWLARSQQVYPLSTDGVLFLPGYSDLAAFIRANSGRAVQASTVMFTPVMQVTDDYFGRSGEGKDWESMRDAAAAARSVYLAVYREGRFQVQVVGRLEEAQPAPADHPQVAFEAGPLIMTSAARQVEPGRWAITLDWYARGSLADHEIFVHVVDASGQAVAQSDGPALGGMLPIWNWRSGDRIRDVRYVELAERDNGPYTVRVGVYATSGERIPATSENGAPYADGAATIVTLRP